MIWLIVYLVCFSMSYFFFCMMMKQSITVAFWVAFVVYMLIWGSYTTGYKLTKWFLD